MNLLTKYNEDPLPHRLRRHFFKNDASEISEKLQAWASPAGMEASMAEMGGNAWINRLYTKTFPGHDHTALHRAFRRPELLLRYMTTFREEPQVVTVMQEWVGAV